MKLLVLTIGDAQTGSTKYRILQYERFLQEQGLDIQFVHRNEIDSSTIDIAAQADVVLNQKCLFSVRSARRLIRSSRRTVFDFDDAIYTRPGRPHSWFTRIKLLRRLHLWLEASDVVTCANEYLAEYARRYSKNVRVIPMALDLEEWKPADRRESDEVRIGWAGSPINATYLESLEPVLRSIQVRNPKVHIMVYSGRRPQLSCRFEFVPFEPGTERDFVSRLDIGLLPLRDEEYLRGKSPIKAIQYLSCGVPVVGTVVGATAEILNPDNSIAVRSHEEWLSALQCLIGDPERRAKMGRAGRELVARRHDALRCRAELLNVITGRAGSFDL